jgi:hypothetical protein
VEENDQETALIDAATESIALEELVDSGHTPRCLACDKMRQDQSMPYPGSYIHILVMSKVPGQNVQELLLDLTEKERAIIRVQLTDLLE